MASIDASVGEQSIEERLTCMEHDSFGGHYESHANARACMCIMHMRAG